MLRFRVEALGFLLNSSVCGGRMCVVAVRYTGFLANRSLSVDQWLSAD